MKLEVQRNRMIIIPDNAVGTRGERLRQAVQSLQSARLISPQPQRKENVRPKWHWNS